MSVSFLILHLYHAIENTANQNTGKPFYVWQTVLQPTTNLPIMRCSYMYVTLIVLTTVLTMTRHKIVTSMQQFALVVYLVNKPLQAAGMSADNVRGWEIVRKVNIWPGSEASRANVKFWGQSLSQGIISRHTSKPERGLFIL